MDVLLISGGRAAHLQAVQNLYGRMDKQKTSFLKLDSVGDVFAQAVSARPIVKSQIPLNEKKTMPNSSN